MPNLDFRKIPTTKKIAILNIAIAFAILLTATFLIYPKIENAEFYRTNIFNQKQQLSQEQLRETNQNASQPNINSIEPKLNELAKGVIKPDQDLDFIRQLETIAAKNDAKSKLSMGDKKPFGKFQKAQMQIYLQIDFNKLLSYLHDLEGSEYYISLQNIELTPQSADGSSVNATISADTYWQQ